MTRTAIVFLFAAAVTGCYTPRDAYEPRDDRAPVASRVPPPRWYRTDGATGIASAPAGPTQSVAARVPAKLPADAAPHSDGQDAALEKDLVQGTLTPAPGNPPPSAGPVLEGPGGSAKSGPIEVGGMLPPSGASPAAGGIAFRLLNSKRIAFGYEVQDGAPGTVVEVWGTQDLKSWIKYEPVARTAHGCVVEVAGEGLYGFLLRARAEGSAAPAAGEPPQAWVAVDVTKPAVRLLATEVAEGGKAPALVVRWSVQDRNLGPRPVTLAWSEKGEGPWTTIAANVENTGRYEWAPPRGTPSSVYLRVQAADLMGNVGTAQTPNRLVLPRPAGDAAGKELEVISGYEPAKPPSPPRLVTLPPTPPLDLPRPAPASHPRVSVVSVEPERN
jgi:hypothetical protein